MNKKRRKEIIDNINVLIKAKNRLEEILSDEQDYFDNMPENLQGSIRGEDSETAIDALTDAIEDIDNSISYLNDIV